MSRNSYFDRAADALTLALKTNIGAEQGRLLDEALRLNDLALAEERKRRIRAAADFWPDNDRGPMS